MNEKHEKVFHLSEKLFTFFPSIFPFLISNSNEKMLARVQKKNEEVEEHEKKISSRTFYVVMRENRGKFLKANDVVLMDHIFEIRKLQRSEENMSA